MNVYNTLTKSKEPFQSLTPNVVKMYVCGVTVYDLCHIGHARAYVVFDVIRRFLEFLGYTVTYVQNFTDVDDKIINRAKERGLAGKALSESMIQAYFDDMDRLNIVRASHYPKVTEHIPQIISFIEGLVAKEAAYLADDGIYFSVRKSKNYGKLSRRDIEEMKAGTRATLSEKKQDPLDFALWKLDSESDLSWPSPWGQGRPGWHIECSAMSREYLGETFDMHGGGQDLVFPHHENEIAQSEALTGKPMAKFWLHNGFVRSHKEKMSKSLGNFFTIRDVLKTVDPMVLRLFFLMTHYRQPINYSFEELEDVRTAFERIRHVFTIKDLHPVEAEPVDHFRKIFMEAMEDDFNTAKAVGTLFDLVRQINVSKSLGLVELLRALLQVLGLKITLDEAEIPESVAQLAKERWEAKQAKEWARADSLRKKIQEEGYVMEDAKEGYKVRKC
ncbi:MAG: cysteine--tRNA ligase [Candidatus Margulisiibacteriota bacterium]